MAHNKAKKDKKHYKEIQKIESNLEYYINSLSVLLKEERYSISKDDYSIEIKNDKGKLREIRKLSYYPHRIVQWAIILKIEDKLFNSFIYDTYSSIKNRGLHFGVNRVKKILNKNSNKTKYCLKLDISKYYDNIDKRFLKLLRMIIFSNGEKGQPIGSLISQWSGNLYLTPLDKFLKEQLKCKFYFRYCDDIVVLGETKEELFKIFKEINNFVSQRLHLQLKRNYQVFPIDKRGIDFLGYRFFHNYSLLRKRILKNIKSSLKKIDNTRILTYKENCTINSYKGWLKYCNSYRLHNKYFKPFQNKKYINQFSEIRVINI